MNHRSESLMPISKAITGFINHKMAEGLSPRTVAGYERLLNKWIEHRGDQNVDQVSSKHILAYLSWLRTDYQPKRMNKEVHPLSCAGYIAHPR